MELNGLIGERFLFMKMFKRYLLLTGLCSLCFSQTLGRPGGEFPWATENGYGVPSEIRCIDPLTVCRQGFFSRGMAGLFVESKRAPVGHCSDECGSNKCLSKGRFDWQYYSIHEEPVAVAVVLPYIAVKVSYRGSWARPTVEESTSLERLRYSSERDAVAY